jgi:hypothetical protein
LKTLYLRVEEVIANGASGDLSNVRYLEIYSDGSLQGAITSMKFYNIGNNVECLTVREGGRFWDRGILKAICLTRNLKTTLQSFEKEKNQPGIDKADIHRILDSCRYLQAFYFKDYKMHLLMSSIVRSRLENLCMIPALFTRKSRLPSVILIYSRLEL